mmetsp:Transcript_37817/g.75731  ORF Transcript_37817/g.75731 Transcript_37817/m.75731 type:complete len:126 (-) Transcript_37817:85-462(-)
MLQMDLCVSSFSQAHIAKREKRKKREKEQKKQAKRNQKKMQQKSSTSRDEAKAFAKKKDVLEQHPYSALHQVIQHCAHLQGVAPDVFQCPALWTGSQRERVFTGISFRQVGAFMATWEPLTIDAC